MIKPRYFNNLTLDLQKGVIIKKSQFAEYLNSEIKWYLKFPKKFRAFIPEIIDYSIGPKPYLTLKFYNSPTLGELFIKGKLSTKTWDSIFDKVFHLVNLFENEKKYVNKKVKEQTLKEMYYNKTLKRLRMLYEDKKWFNSNILENTLLINNKEYSIRNFFYDFRIIMNSYLKKSNTKNFSLIHGDLCASNILFLEKNNNLILIDPRGSFGKFIIHGDIYYDLAKLSHSFLGFYELILNNSFKLKFNERKINYSIKSSPKQDKISKIFKRKILEKYDLNEVRFIESLLFLSMIPLHAEDFRRQIVFLAQGLELFYQSIDNNI